jgi:hypothetical protein
MRRLVGILVTALAGLVLSTNSASAAPYDPFTDTNPATTGCSADAITIASRPIRSPQAVYGTMEVRYSPTCGTNWVRSTMYVENSSFTVTKGIVRMSSQPDGHGGWLGYYQNYETDPAVGTSFGMQVYAPGNTCIEAMSTVRDANGQLVAQTGTPVPYDPWVAFC